MSTVVLYSEEDAKAYLSNPPSADRILPLTPNASAFLIGKSDVPILDPLDYFFDDSHKLVLERVKSIEEEFYPILYKEKKLGLAAKETFRGMFHGLSSKILYLWFCIKDVGPWIIRDENRWERENELSRAHKLLCIGIHNSEKGLFNGSFFLKVKKRTPYLSIISRGLNKITKILINDYKCFFFTGSSNAFNFLQKKIIEFEKNSKFIEIEGATNFKNVLLSFVKLIKCLIYGSKNLNLLIIPEDQDDTSSTIEYLLDKIKDNVLNNADLIVKASIIPAVAYTEGLSKGSVELIKNLREVTLISHQSRLIEGAVISELFKKNNFRSILISHGSHPYFEDNFERYEHKENAQGLLFSPLATVAITQSPCAYKSSKLYMPDLPRKKFKPIMWGYTNNNLNIIKKNNKRIILHAGTTNKLNGRPWIYETSNEFVNGLKKLINSVDELKDTHLIIRVRPNLEWNIKSLKKLLPDSTNFTIKTKGSFLDDLNKADLLISYSSTTIEESLHARKPVGLFGGSDRYRHLPGSDKIPNKMKRNAVYHLTKNNLCIMLDAILESHKDSLLTDAELNGYVWPEWVPNYEEFISYLLD